MYVVPQTMRMKQAVIVDQEMIDWRGANNPVVHKIAKRRIVVFSTRWYTEN